MQLNQRSSFKKFLCKGTRLQIPELTRQQFTMETNQLSSITIAFEEGLGAEENFRGKKRRDGCIKNISFKEANQPSWRVGLSRS